MTYTLNKIINKEQPRFVVWSLLTVIFVGLFAYGYCVRSTIVNIVARQDMEKEIHFISSTVLDLEAQYVKAKNQVTLELAQNSGFVAVSSQTFVSAKDNTALGLSVNLR